MLTFLDMDTFVKDLSPITSIEIFDKIGSFNEDGLFSEKIFGPVGSSDRRITFSYINLYTNVIHPVAYKLLIQLDRKIEKFISTEELFILNNDGHLVVDDSGITGISELISIFPKIKFRGETKTREKLIKFISTQYKNGTLFVSYLPIIPPELRPATRDENGNWMIDRLNDIYISIMRKVSQVRASGKGPLKDLLVYSLQKTVIDHDEYIRQKIQKKSGIIRNQMLGKRVDFSGRAVITPGPDLGVNEIGLPLRIASTIFEPFILHILLFTDKIDRSKLKDEVYKFT